MLKRTMLYIFVLSTLALLAMGPLNLTSASENTHKAQATVEVTVIVETPGPTLAPSAPATGEISQSTLIIIGLLVIILLVIVIGGAILINSRRES